MNFITVEQVNNYIKETLLKCVTFDLEEGHKISTKTQSKLGVYFYEKNSNPKIFHLIFANEGSKAGNYFNDFTLEKLEENFIGVTDLKNFDAVESVKERFIEISKEIIETNESAITKNDFENSEKKMIKLNTSKDIVLKKYYIDELGFSNLKINGFEPTYNYYKKEKDNQIIIRVEVPGNFELLPEIEYSGQYTKIKLTGEKKKDKEPQNLEDNIHNSRNFGKFFLDIPLKTADYLISNEEPEITRSQGVHIIKYKLANKVKGKVYKTEENEEI